MVPKIAEQGHSFKGAGLYYLHDKEAATSERVAWTQTNNLRTNDPEKAMKVMAWTAIHSDDLKRQSGQSMAGAKQTTGPVYSYSLAWHTEQAPTQTEMLHAAAATLERLGLSEHESVIVCHQETAHKHIHIIANLVHPTTGLKRDTGLDQRALQKWALDYEKEHGKIYCKEREENAQKRENDEITKYQDERHEAAQRIEKLYHASDSGKAFKQALESEGLTLARGDKKRLVIVDRNGKIQNLARQINGVKSKDIKAKLSDLDPATLPEANQVRQEREAQREAKKKEAAQTAQAKEQAQRKAEFNRKAAEKNPAPKSAFNQTALVEEEKQKAFLKKALTKKKAAHAEFNEKSLAEEKAQKKKKFLRQALGQTPTAQHQYNKAAEKKTEQKAAHQQTPMGETLRQKQRYQMQERQRDELIAFDIKARNKRDLEKKKLDEFYKTKEVKRHLREAEKELKTKSGVLSRITGKQKAAQEKAEGLRLNLAGIHKQRGQAMKNLDVGLARDKAVIKERHKQEAKIFENSPTQKYGTAKVFEKEVLKKGVSNQNQKASRGRDRENGRS